MILEYEKTQKIYAENGCEHIVDGVVRFDDLIETKYKPTNFSAETKYYYLRNNHVDWDKMQQEQEQKIQKEWLVELGYDPTLWQVEASTKKIIPNHRLFDDVGMTESEQI
tara:strand:- start:2076 stop:2405 length:330 start_codon:yes stop_codon:yes gene_type:complete